MMQPRCSKSCGRDVPQIQSHGAKSERQTGVIAHATLSAAAAIILGGWFGSSVACASSCPKVDLYTRFQKLALAVKGATSDEQVRAFRRYAEGPAAAVYQPDVLGVEAGPELDRKALSALDAARTAPSSSGTIKQLDRILANVDQQFQSQFSDFRCDFTVYYIDSLMQLDGAGRVVDGRRALVLGVDQLDKERASISLPVFVAHEMFHRYHFQAAGFSDDLGEHQEIWRVLWAEGLASYASMVVVPGATVKEALMLPLDLEVRATPLMKKIAADLLGHLDEIDADTFGTYFTYGDHRVIERGLPWRSGYFVGFLIAREMSKTHSLDQLAHLKGETLKQSIAVALQRLST